MYVFRRSSLIMLMLYSPIWQAIQLNTSARSSLRHGTPLCLGARRFCDLYRCWCYWTGASQYSPHQLFVHTKLLAGTLDRHRCGGAFLISAERGRLGGYNLADWDNPSKYVPRGSRNDILVCSHVTLHSYALNSPFSTRRLPIGIAAMLANRFGIAGAVVGMSQVWYTGRSGK